MIEYIYIKNPMISSSIYCPPPSYEECTSSITPASAPVMDIHEFPVLNSKGKSSQIFEEGMKYFDVVTNNHADSELKTLYTSLLKESPNTDNSGYYDIFQKAKKQLKELREKNECLCEMQMNNFRFIRNSLSYDELIDIRVYLVFKELEKQTSDSLKILMSGLLTLRQERIKLLEHSVQPILQKMTSGEIEQIRALQQNLVITQNKKDAKVKIEETNVKWECIVM